MTKLGRPTRRPDPQPTRTHGRCLHPSLTVQDSHCEAWNIWVGSRYVSFSTHGLHDDAVDGVAVHLLLLLHGELLEGLAMPPAGQVGGEEEQQRVGGSLSVCVSFNQPDSPPGCIG